MALDILKEKREKAPRVKKYKAPKEKKERELILPKEKKVREPKVKKEKAPKAEKAVKEKKEGKINLPQIKLPKIKLPDLKKAKNEGSKIKIPVFFTAKKKPIKEDKKRIFTLSVRLLLLCLLPMVLACLIITLFSANRLRAGLEAEIEKSLKIVATSVNETYTNLYEGDYKSGTDGGSLYKGETLITGETGLIDSIQTATGFDVSMLYGNMRLITTFRKENGARINGVGISKDVYNQLTAGEATFLSNYSVIGKEYYILYLPLVNSDGSVIGAIEAGVESSNVDETINKQIVGIVGFSVLFVLIAAAAVVLLSRGLVKGLKAIRDYLHKIANGDLGARAETSMENRDDELGDIYRMAIRLRDTIRHIVNEIKLSATRLNESADQLIDMAENTNAVVEDVIQAVGEISQGAKQQADDTAETNDSIIRMGKQIENIVEEVINLNKNANKMATEEEESERIINELNVSNNETKEAVMQVAEQITVMSESIRDITSALDMIRNVADETTLLALNASIEAARVGEAGRGFAVVAQQINKLAEQSNSSIGKIEKVIDSVVSTSERMVVIMADVKGKMEQQQDKLDETMSKSVAVANEVENSKQKIEMIRGNVDHLSEFGTTIGGAVSNLAAVSYENAAAADNTKDSADSMSTTMSELQEASGKLVELSKELEKSLGLFKL